MLRKNIRMRKEYLFAKSQENAQKSSEHKRMILQKAQAKDGDNATPNEMRKEIGNVRKDLELADSRTIIARSHVDDEYEEAKYRDPKIFITTCRDPSQRLISF
jgi:U3 small nucleolar ribonucleoprotein protein IMP4